MKELYSVGEVAKIFNVSIDTLRYYDKLDLLKPISRKPGGRRFYSKTQFEYISTLLLLKSSGTSLAKLNSIIHQETPDKMIEELIYLKENLRNKINELIRLENRVQVHLDNVLDVSHLGDIVIKRFPDIWMLKKDFDIEDNLDIQEIVSITGSTEGEWIYHANIFSTLSSEAIKEHDFHTYESYGYMSEYQPKTINDNFYKLPSRLYASMNVVSRLTDLSDLDPKYMDLLSFIKENGFKVDGYTIERNVLDLMSDNGSIHFFKIYMPIVPIMQGELSEKKI